MATSSSSPSPSSSSSPSPSSHPRRVPVSSGHGLSLQTNTMLRKGATFHSSPTTSPVSDRDAALFCPPALPRAQSNLDDVVDAHRRRVALTLDSIGKALAARRSPGSLQQQQQQYIASRHPVVSLFDDDCVPRGILEHTIVRPPPAAAAAAADEQPRRILQPRSANSRRPASQASQAGQHHRHASDSGLGSSVASSSSGKKRKGSSPTQAVTRSVGAVPVSVSVSSQPAGLSARATSRIYEHTVKPLLAKPAYKPFHSILLACTTDINKKSIVCLRDLEKTILYRAQRTKAAKLYLAFCLDSVRCLQTTVEYLAERDQTRPADPPYTAGYFIDLVEQIHHYAQQLADAAAARHQTGAAAGDDATEEDMAKNGKDAKDAKAVLDVHRSEHIKLHGGLAVNGRPAELVRVRRDGRAVSLATGLPVDLVEEEAKADAAIRVKRSASQEAEDEEEIMRSMARRKKNAPPEEYAPKMCSVPGCTKEFKRPCDLTKHEKTHSRPWKCPIESCKYHEYGWPTEKECDRHRNDKHSDNPPMYECLFKPCTYKSKRDSNRKQHMEKTHGWTYVRTKTNGTGAGAGATKAHTPAAGAGASASPPSDGSVARAASSSSPSAAPTSHQATPPLVNNLPTPVSVHSPALDTPPLDEFAAPLYEYGPLPPHVPGHPHPFADLAELEFPTCAPADILATDMSLPMEMTDADLDFASGMPLDLHDTSAYASPSTVSSLDNNSAYQEIGPDMAMYEEDLYTATVHLPTPEWPAAYAPLMAHLGSSSSSGGAADDAKGLLDRFMAISAPDLCAPMVTPEQRLQLARLQQEYQQMQEQRPHEPELQLQPQHQQQQQQQQPLPHISPLGEGNTMLFTPDSMVDDEGFVDYAVDPAKKGTDFILFPETLGTVPATAMTTMTATTALSSMAPAAGGLYKQDEVFDLFDGMVPNFAGLYSQATAQAYGPLDY